MRQWTRPSRPIPSLSGRGEIDARFRETASSVMIEASKALRQRQTGAESLLWEHLRDRRLDGIKFRRQHALANTTYMVDCYCYESRLAIELDGSIHDQQQEADVLRQQEIEALGDAVFRFRNEQVFTDLK